MPREITSLQAFNRGKISKLGLARTDLDRTRLSAEEQNNYVPRVLGSMMLRPGLGYIDNTYSDLKAIKRLTDAKTDADDLKEDVRKLLVHAKANDAQKDPVGFPPATSWQRARSYGSSGRYRNHPYR